VTTTTTTTATPNPDPDAGFSTLLFEMKEIPS
jgi:hypothetical protein